MFSLNFGFKVKPRPLMLLFTSFLFKVKLDNRIIASKIKIEIIKSKNFLNELVMQQLLTSCSFKASFKTPNV
jgi:hypothetical protein